MLPELPSPPTAAALAIALALLLVTGLAWIRQRRASRAAQTQAHLLQVALREREHLYSSLLSNMPGAAYRCTPDDDWSVLFISDAMERLSGWPAESYYASPTLLREFVHEDDQPAVRAQIQLAIEANQPFTVEYRAVHRSGRTFWVWEQGTAIRDDAGHVVSLDGVIIDISERKATELALQRAKTEAEVAAAAKTTFLANMGHEVRTPLNAILGFSGIVMGRPLDETQREHMKKVQEAAKALLQLVNEILDLAKLERGTLTLHPEVFSVTALARAALMAQQGAARRKGLALQLEADPALPDMVRGDPRRLRQVLDRLLDNAVKFTEKGSVCLQIAQDGGQLLLAVHDTGIGIAPESQKQIFEAFTQADASMSRRYGGTGLGVTMARQLVEHMGGTVRLQSKLGQGSSFTIRLPLAAARPAAAEPATAAPALLPAVRMEPARIEMSAVHAPWSDSVAQIIHALRSGEAPDASLPELLEHLRRQGQETLAAQMEHALADFDLDRAAELLETMPARL